MSLRVVRRLLLGYSLGARGEDGARSKAKGVIDMDVRGVFELPIPIWVMRDALSATYPTGFGDLRFTVVMPEDGSPVGPPPLAGIQSRPGLDGDDVVWAQEYAASTRRDVGRSRRRRHGLLPR